MKYKRLVIMGDGKVLRYNGKFYSNDRGSLDCIKCFKGIEEVVVWGRIIDVSRETIKDYHEINLTYEGKRVSIDGIYNPPNGRIKGVLCTIREDYKKLSRLYRTPSLVFMGSGSPSQWLTWYMFRRRDLKFIGRKIGFPEPTISAFKNPCIKLMIKLYLSHFDHVFYRKCILQSWVSKGLENRFADRKVPSVVWHDVMITEKEIVDHVLQRKNEIFELLFVGRLVIQKGVADLIKAMSELSDENIRLTIIGDGADRQMFEEMVRDKDLQDRVIFKGQIRWGDLLWKEMQAAHCLIIPSYNEGLGMVCVEAMANGIPVIGSNQGGIPDIVKDYSNGLLIEPGNIESIKRAILTLYRDETLRENLAENALKTARENTRESQLKKFSEAYMKYVYPQL